MLPRASLQRRVCRIPVQTWREGGESRLESRQRLQGLRTEIAEVAEIEGRRFREISDQVRAPVAEADDTDTQTLVALGPASWSVRPHQPVSRLRSIRSGVRSSSRMSRP